MFPPGQYDHTVEPLYKLAAANITSENYGATSEPDSRASNRSERPGSLSLKPAILG